MDLRLLSYAPPQQRGLHGHAKQRQDGHRPGLYADLLGGPADSRVPQGRWRGTTGTMRHCSKKDATESTGTTTASRESPAVYIFTQLSRPAPPPTGINPFPDRS